MQEMTAHEAAKECKGVYLGETPSILRPQDLGIGLLFERMREGVIVADVQSGRIFLWNPGAEKIFGYAADEAVGLPLEVLVPARLQARHQAAFAQYRATGHGLSANDLRSVALVGWGAGLESTLKGEPRHA